jgi:hypothetical protein
VALRPELPVVEDEVEEDDAPPEDVVVVELPETEGVPEELVLHAARRRPVVATATVSAMTRRAMPFRDDSEIVDIGISLNWSAQNWSPTERSECRLLQGAAAQNEDGKKLQDIYRPTGIDN